MLFVLHFVHVQSIVDDCRFKILVPSTRLIIPPSPILMPDEESEVWDLNLAEF